MIQFRSFGGVFFGDIAGHFTHAPKIIRPFGHADGAARIQHIKQVAALENTVIGGDKRVAFQRAGIFAFIKLKHLTQRIHIGNVKIIAAVFKLFIEHQLGIAKAIQPVNRPGGFFVLQRQGDSLDAIGDLDADWIEAQAAGLLKIGELRNFLAVEPDFPAQSPGAQGRRFPVILDKADVMFAREDAQGFQRGQIEFLRVAGVGLQDDLILIVFLHSVRILAKAAIVGADAWLDVGGAPGLWAQDFEQSRRVARPGADLHIVRLPNHAMMRCPKLMQL